MILDRFRITGQVAVVTGAGRGIGAAAAVALAQAGADVVIAARTEDQLAKVASEIEAAGRRAVVVPADLSDLDAAAGLAAAAADAFGRLDIVVNNVGGAMPRPFLATKPRHLARAFQFNVEVAHALTQAAVPHLLASGPAGENGAGENGAGERGAGHAGREDEAGGAAGDEITGDQAASSRPAGTVINISSAVGRVAGRGYLAYGTAKAALAHYTRLAAADLAPRIRVNAIAVGSVATSALDIVLTDDTLRAQMERETLLGRIADPEDIAAAIVYLASPASAYITGKILEVDGGLNRPNLDLGIPSL
jgi:7-alpha-hydroxysteroid dehydrogenase